MFDRFHRTINSIGVILGLEIETTPASGGGEEEGRKNPSISFRFSNSKEDQGMGEMLGFNEQEMNQLLEQARRERDSGEGKDNAAPADAEDLSQFPEETAETTESPDPRSVSQIINSIREITRSLNLEQRRSSVKKIRDESRALKRFFASITEEQMKNDTAWLQCIQNLFNEMQKRSHEVPKGLLKETLLELEELFERFGTE